MFSVTRVSLIKIALMGCAPLALLGTPSGCTPKGTRTTRVASEVDPRVELEKLISAKQVQQLQEFVTEFKTLRKGLDGSDGAKLADALRQLRADLQNQDVDGATQNLAAAVGGIEPLRRASELFGLLQTSVQASDKPQTFTSNNPLWDASGQSYLELVKRPSNQGKYIFWQSLVSTNPFDVLSIAQDPTAELVHVESYEPPSKETREKRRGTTVFVTLSATAPDSPGLSQAMQSRLKDVPSEQLAKWREARGVCSDLLAPEDMAPSVAPARRVFEFLTPTAGNAVNPTLAESRSPVLVLMPPQVDRDTFLSEVLESCQEQKLKTDSLKKLEQEYDVVAAFKLPGQGTFRVLKATLRFGTPASTAQQGPAAKPGIDLFWLQQELVNELPQPVVEAR